MQYEPTSSHVPVNVGFPHNYSRIYFEHPEDINMNHLSGNINQQAVEYLLQRKSNGPSPLPYEYLMETPSIPPNPF